MGANPRVAAHRILKEVRSGAFADRSAARILPTVAPRDRGLAQDLAYGCLRLRGRLDTELAVLTDRPLDRIDANVLDWLRLGLYQLREMRVPDHAAVAETVRHASRNMDPGRVGFINAVLRAATKGPRLGDPYPSRDEDPVGYLSTYGSHPEWLVRRWLGRWGWHDAFRLVKQNNVPPPVFVRLLGPEGPEDAARVAGDDVEVAPMEGAGGFDSRSCELVRGTPARLLETVPAVVQDPAASAVVDYAGRELEGPVYDACAAPGTKAMVLSHQVPEAQPYVAADASAERLERVVESGARLGAQVFPIVADGRRPGVGRARTVLLDVPCTGTGVLRRRPDARWRLSDDRLASLTTLQGELLDGCASIVEPGGLLIYATCSLEPEENEVQIESFLERREEFERDPPRDSDLPPEMLTASGDLFVRPWIAGTDGAYATRLRRGA
jgi:16S rRNA (cytosine967-C5)-methyltransferase